MKKLFPVATLWLFTFTLLPAQTRVVTGTVTDAGGQALPGVTVQLKNTSFGAVTGVEGDYRLEVPAGQNTLVFSFIGFQTREEEIADRTRVDVQFEENGSYLDELVVTGFGSRSKRRITSSIASVNEEVFTNSPAMDVQNALQGRMAGVVFSNTSGYANSESSIRIRGVGSITAGNQPLFVIDGLVLSGRINNPTYGFGYNTNPFINLNPNDIESVEVLKDAAASAIYGSRGSNGVILITTKSGQYNTRPKVHIGYWAGFSEPSKKLRFLNGKEWAASWNQAARNVGDTSALLDVNAQPSTDWVDLLLQKGFEQETNAGVSGGSRTTRYYIGATVRDEEGFLKTTGLQRYAVRVNIDQMIGEKVTTGMSVAPSRVKTSKQDNFNAPFYNAFYTLPNVEAFDEFGKPKGIAEIGAQGSPYTNLVESWGDLSSNQVLFNGYINYNPLENLTLRTSCSVESVQREELFKYGSRTFYGYPSGYGTAFNQETFNYNWTALATWRNLNTGKHDLDISAGFNLTKETLDHVYQTGTSYPDDRLLYIGSAAQTTTTSGHTEAGFTGVLARANYALSNRYLLTLSARYDGSSRFGVENRYGFFPAVSAGWIISDERFYNLQALNFLKLRTSFGIAGNAEIGDFASKGLVRFGQNYNGLPGYDIKNIENDQLAWEKNLQWDAGLEFALFSNRIRGELAYYIKDTRDLLLAAPIPATNGFESLTRNVGAVRNQGFEFELSADILTGPFNWAIQANGATLKNEVLKLIDADGDGRDDDINSDGRFLFRPGLPIGTFYLVEFAGVDPDNGDALFWNANKTQKLVNVFSDANRQIVGHAIPKFTGGFTNVFGYKNFQLSVFFEFKTGYQIYMLDGGGRSGVWTYSNVLKEAADDVWTPDNRYTDIPQNRLFTPNGSGRTSRNLFDGDYLRLKNLTLGYTFPAFGQWSRQLYVFAAGQNLWTLTNYPGLDPDASFYNVSQAEQGAILSPPPSKLTCTFGLSLVF